MKTLKLIAISLLLILGSCSKEDIETAPVDSEETFIDTVNTNRRVNKPIDTSLVDTVLLDTVKLDTVIIDTVKPIKDYVLDMWIGGTETDKIFYGSTYEWSLKNDTTKKFKITIRYTDSVNFLQVHLDVTNFKTPYRNENEQRIDFNFMYNQVYYSGKTNEYFSITVNRNKDFIIYPLVSITHGYNGTNMIDIEIPDDLKNCFIQFFQRINDYKEGKSKTI